MKRTIIALLFLPFLSIGQEAVKGMKFEHGLSWAEVQAKAKAENKFIFMDCFTTWCGPCKFMSANIFPQDAVGDFYNEKYIMVKVQLDTTKDDNEQVKKWYRDGHDLAAKYNVQAYPTYLFFDPSGQVVHRTVGSSDATTFVGMGKDALNPDKQYYTQLRKYEKGEKDPAFLRNLSLMAMTAYDMKTASVISEKYIATQSDLFTKENIAFIDKFTSKSTDKGFAMMLNNTAKIDAAIGSGKAEKKIMDIITQEEFYPVYRKSFATNTTPDFDALQSSIAKKYPAFAEEVVASSKVTWYQSRKDWPHFEVAVVAYMKKYGAAASSEELNSYAWTVFENCKDMSCVTEALDWSKRSFADKQNPMFMDTYANILHKLGKTKEAIEWEEKAIALIQDNSEKKSYQETLEKMRKGEKTWN